MFFFLALMNSAHLSSNGAKKKDLVSLLEHDFGGSGAKI